MSVIHKIAVVLLLLTAQTALAALPPRYQNVKDLDVMVEFIKRNETVASTLSLIDVDSYTVYFGEDCQAVFGREARPKPPGWVGPADPLVFKRSNCEISQ